MSESFGPSHHLSSMDELYLDDLHIGQRFTSVNYIMDAAKIKVFAAEYGPQPFHLDEGAAQASIFKGRAERLAYGACWYAAPGYWRAAAGRGRHRFGWRDRLAQPTHPGDSLHVESEVVEITPSRSKPHQGIVTVRDTMFNQDHEAVYVLTAKLLVPKRANAN